MTDKQKQEYDQWVSCILNVKSYWFHSLMQIPFKDFIQIFFLAYISLQYCMQTSFGNGIHEIRMHEIHKECAVHSDIPQVAANLLPTSGFRHQLNVIKNRRNKTSHGNTVAEGRPSRVGPAGLREKRRCDTWSATYTTDKVPLPSLLPTTSMTTVHK